MTTQLKPEQTEANTTYTEGGETGRVAVLEPEPEAPAAAPEWTPEWALQQAAPQPGLFTLIGQVLVAFYDWLSGPPMTELQRIERKIAETRNERYIRSGF